jgi:hypothetical protein
MPDPSDNYDATEQFMEAMGVPVDYQPQLEIMVEALKIRAQREGVYKGLWRKFGYTDSLFHMRSKMERLMIQFWDGTGHSAYLGEDLDNALDLLNYTTFFVTLFREGRRNG